MILRTWLLEKLVKEAKALKVSRETKQLINSGKGKSCSFSSLKRKVGFPHSTINMAHTFNKSLCVLRWNVCLVTAQERVNEMEAKLDKLLATLDRAVKIEMMKMPQSLHTTLIKDILSGRLTLLFSVDKNFIHTFKSPS